MILKEASASSGGSLSSRSEISKRAANFIDINIYNYIIIYSMKIKHVLCKWVKMNAQERKSDMDSDIYIMCGAKAWRYSFIGWIENQERDNLLYYFF